MSFVQTTHLEFEGDGSGGTVVSEKNIHIQASAVTYVLVGVPPGGEGDPQCVVGLVGGERLHIGQGAAPFKNAVAAALP